MRFDIRLASNGLKENNFIHNSAKIEMAFLRLLPILQPQ